MPVYSLPTFNIEVGIYRASLPPPLPPSVTATGQLRVGSLTSTQYWQTNTSRALYRFLLLPRATDIRTVVIVGTSANDIVEAPLLSGVYYDCIDIERRALGFPNEHILAVLQPRDDWPLTWSTPGT